VLSLAGLGSCFSAYQVFCPGQLSAAPPGAGYFSSAYPGLAPWAAFCRRFAAGVCSGLGLHVGAEDGVDAGLVAGVLAEPAEQVGVEAHGYDFFGHGHDDLGVFPEGFVGGVGVGIGENSTAYVGRCHAAQLVPVRDDAVLNFCVHPRRL
jgi:hypothetical protein